MEHKPVTIDLQLVPAILERPSAPEFDRKSCCQKWGPLRNPVKGRLYVSGDRTYW
jgi:hypothetical protein